MNPKELLASQVKNSKVGLNDGDNQGAVKVAGKQGFIYRKNDFDHDTYCKIWIIISERKLFFSHDDFSLNGDKDAEPVLCKGYILLDEESEVKVGFKARLHAPTSSGSAIASSSIDKKFNFQVSYRDTVLILATDTEIERAQWMDVMRQSINEISHYVEYPKLRLGSHSLTQAVVQSVNIDFPHKAGFLKKTSSGKTTLGFKSVKSRWFRLEGGELRYFEDEDARPSTQKGIIDLHGASIDGENSKNMSGCSTKFIHLMLSSGRLMKLEAGTLNLAVEWRDVVSETCFLLQMQVEKETKNRLQNSVTKLRRNNIHDHINLEEKESIIDHRPRANSGIFSFFSVSAPVGLSLSMGGSEDKDQSPVDSKSVRARSNSRFSPSKDPNGSARAAGTASLETRLLLQSCLQEHFLLKTVRDLDAVIDAMGLKVAIPGEVIVWQGSTGNFFYVLESGQCEIVKDNVRIGYVFPNKSFGELALLNNATRQATVRATQVSHLWYLSRENFRSILEIQEAVYLKENLEFLDSIALFDKLQKTAKAKIANVMTLEKYIAGDRIIKQGEVGERFYMIKSGKVIVSQNQVSFMDFIGGGDVKASDLSEIARLGPNQYFGELALINKEPRKATITASTATSCWTLDRSSFQSIFGSMKEALDENFGEGMLRKVKILESLSEKQLHAVTKCLESKTYEKGEVIIKQGEHGDDFYLIAEGEVSVEVNHVQVATLCEGGFFGEMALLSNERRSATVSAATESIHCLVINRIDFDTLLGPLDAIIKEESRKRSNSSSLSAVFRRESAAAQLSAFFKRDQGSERSSGKSSSPREATPAFESTKSIFEIPHLKKMQQIGTGTFSALFLVNHIQTSKNYALKQIPKLDAINKCQQSYIFSERDLMQLMDHQFIVPLYATLQDSKNLYYVQQYVPGGDLWTVLYSEKLTSTKQGGLPIKQVAFYISTVLSALMHIHDNDIIHRDLKPENLVLDAYGYLKICDFGSAKSLAFGAKTNTLCGCAEYLSPETILSKGYDKAVDFWSLGILVFELLSRKTPFPHDNVAMIYQKIVESEENLKLILAGSHLSADATHLVQGLLHPQSSLRLGMLRFGIEEIWDEPFFKNITLEQIERRAFAPSYIPEGGGAAMSPLEEVDIGDDFDDREDEAGENEGHYTGTFDFSSF